MRLRIVSTKCVNRMKARAIRPLCWPPPNKFISIRESVRQRLQRQHNTTQCWESVQQQLQRRGNNIDNILDTLASNETNSRIHKTNPSCFIFFHQCIATTPWGEWDFCLEKFCISTFSIGGKYDSMQIRKILKRNRCIGKKLGKQTVLRYWWHFYASNPQRLPLTPTLIYVSKRQRQMSKRQRQMPKRQRQKYNKHRQIQTQRLFHSYASNHQRPTPYTSIDLHVNENGNLFVFWLYIHLMAMRYMSGFLWIIKLHFSGCESHISPRCTSISVFWR